MGWSESSRKLLFLLDFISFVCYSIIPFTSFTPFCHHFLPFIPFFFVFFFFLHVRFLPQYFSIMVEPADSLIRKCIIWNCNRYLERIPSLSAFMRVSEPQIQHKTDVFIYPLYEINATLYFISCFSHM